MRRALAMFGLCVAAQGGAMLLADVAEARDPTPTELKLSDLDTRLGRVEAVVNNQSLLELSRRIDELETQLRQLRGAQEETQNAAEALVKQQRDLYADLDRRLGALETAVRTAAPSRANSGGASPAESSESRPAVAGASSTASGSGAVNTAIDDQTAYGRAFETLKAGNYVPAIAQWLDFLKNYPASKLQENAQYWLGESYYVTRDYDNAALVFKGLVNSFPNSAKAPDGLLKLAFCQYEQKHLAEAAATLKQVQSRYPDSDAARLAGERLAKMGAGGGAAKR
jgi:tol-pal system protein YbgF